MASSDNPGRAADDLRLNWPSFCDCDPFPGSEDFQERMEAAGLIESVPVEQADLEHPFAAELGIEPGGLKWELTDTGRAAMADGGSMPTPALKRYRSRISALSSIGAEEAAELLDVAAAALEPFATASRFHPTVCGPGNVLLGGDDQCPVTFLDLHQAAHVRTVISAALARSGRSVPEHQRNSGSYWRQEYKGMEQAFMNVKSEYSEVALAMGFEGDTWFGDPLAPHREIVARARDLQQGASVGWLYDNEDVGREFSESHPVGSGEVPDATNVVPATAAALLEELKMAWVMLEEIRRDRDDLARIVGTMKRKSEDDAGI